MVTAKMPVLTALKVIYNMCELQPCTLVPEVGARGYPFKFAHNQNSILYILVVQEQSVSPELDSLHSDLYVFCDLKVIS